MSIQAKNDPATDLHASGHECKNNKRKCNYRTKVIRLLYFPEVGKGGKEKRIMPQWP